MSIKKPRVNREITASEVRLVDAEGLQLGIVATQEALEKAKEAVRLIDLEDDSNSEISRRMLTNQQLLEEIETIKK